MRGLAATGALGLLALAACDDSLSVSPQEPPTASIEPPLLDLGRVFLGQVAEGELVLVGGGGRPADYVARFVGPAAGFFLFGPTGELGPGVRVRIPVAYRPEQAGPVRTRVEFVLDAPGSTPATAELWAEGLLVPDCEDGNGCTDDLFDLELGRCRHIAVDRPCDDFSECTRNDRCVDGICLGEGFSCDDGDLCTDDFCDPREGCVHELRVDCDDDNPCTANLCDAVGGCANEPLPDGTPCDDFEPCTTGDVCVSGRCRGVTVPEGTACDDGDPCSTDERCLDGRCVDPDYVPPTPGRLKFVTELGPLAPGAEENPLVAGDGLIFVGLAAGVAAVDGCGDLVWTATTAAPPRGAATVARPGRLSVAVGARLFELDATDGGIEAELDLSALLPGRPGDEGSGEIRILDLAVRSSGALLAAVERRSNGDVEGFLVEVDAPRRAASLFASLGPTVVRRVAIDRDESAVLLLAEGGQDRVVRLGIEGLAQGSWSTGALPSRKSDLAIGAAGEVLWTAGLTRVARDGEPTTLATPDGGEAGSPVLFGPWIWTAESMGLVARTSTGGVARRIALPPLAAGTSPVVDRRGRIFALDEAGVVHGRDADGNRLFDAPLEPEGPVAGAALALGEDGLLVAVLGGRVYGLQTFEGLALSSWPRHRRDNFGTNRR